MSRLAHTISSTRLAGRIPDNCDGDILSAWQTRLYAGKRDTYKSGVVIEDNTLDHWLSVGGAARVAVRRNTVSDKTGDVGFLGLELIGQDVVASSDFTVAVGATGCASAGSVCQAAHI